MLTRLDPRRQSFTRHVSVASRLDSLQWADGLMCLKHELEPGRIPDMAQRRPWYRPLISTVRGVCATLSATLMPPTNCKVGATGNVDMRQCPGSLGQNAFTKSSYKNAMGYWLPNQFVSLVSQSKERSVKACRGGSRRVNCCPGYLCWKMKHCKCPCQGVSISSESFQLLRMSSTAQD